jgi:hypothetical protein
LAAQSAGQKDLVSQPNRDSFCRENLEVSLGSKACRRESNAVGTGIDTSNRQRKLLAVLFPIGDHYVAHWLIAPTL